MMLIITHFLQHRLSDEHEEVVLFGLFVFLYVCIYLQ
jgi:hypothetical protein